MLWPSVPLVVEAKYIGLGYGITTSVQNGGLAAFPLIIASIYSSSGNTYIPNVEYFFVGLACLGVLVGVYLNLYDCTHGNVFNSAGQKAAAADEDGSRGDSVDRKSKAMEEAEAAEKARTFNVMTSSSPTRTISREVCIDARR